MRARRGIRLVGAVVVALSALGWGIGGGSGPAVAVTGSGPTFNGTASAYGMDFVISNDSLPLGINPEFAGPVAQASLDSLGDSSGSAAYPYLGDTVDGVPGLAGALAGNLPIPAYPLAVASNTSNPHVSQGIPGVQLDANSEVSSASASGTVGAESTGFVSKAEVSQQSDQSVVATAQTTFGANILNLISVSGVKSVATVSADPLTGALTRTTSLSIAQISIPALNVAFPPGTPVYVPIPDPIPGLPQLPPLNLPELPIPIIGGTTLLLPDIGFEDGSFTVSLPVLGKAVTFAIPNGPLLAAFKALGISVTYQQPQSTPTGVIAPVLTFAYTTPSLPSNQYFNGPVGVSFALGKTQASLTLNPVLSTGGGTGSLGGGTPGTSTGTGVGTGSTGGFTSSPASGSGSTVQSTPAASAPLVSASTPATGTSSAPAAAAPSTSNTQTAPAALVDLTQADLSGVYLAAVAVAAVALVGGWILRVLGVRLLWES